MLEAAVFKLGFVELPFGKFGRVTMAFPVAIGDSPLNSLKYLTVSGILYRVEICAERLEASASVRYIMLVLMRQSAFPYATVTAVPGFAFVGLLRDMTGFIFITALRRHKRGIVIRSNANFTLPVQRGIGSVQKVTKTYGISAE
jgi:hypothetical protein